MRFVSNWKVAVLLAFAFAGTVQAGGCSDREILAGGVGALVGAAIANSVNSPPPRCHESMRSVRYPVYDYYGNFAGYGYDNRTVTVCDRRYKMSVSSNSAAEIDVVGLAVANKISPEAANQFVDALKAAQSGDESSTKQALASICLNVEDFKSVSNGGSISAEKNDCIAKSLNQDPRVVSAMVESIVETGRAQQAARNQNHNN